MGKKSVLIIGGTGCLSSAVVKSCLDDGLQVVTINRGHHQDKLLAGVELLKADKHDADRIKTGLNGRHFDAVIDFLSYTKEDLNKSLELYSQFADQYIFLSSCAVYKMADGRECDEDSEKVNQSWPYSVQKWDAECFLEKKASELGLHYTIVRPSITFGDTRIPYGIMPPYGYHGTVLKRIAARKPLIRWEGGETGINMMRVEDFARALVMLIGDARAYGEAFNISGEEYYTFNDVIKSLERKLGQKIELFDVSAAEYAAEVPRRYGEIISGRTTTSKCSMAKFKRLYPEYKQEYNLDEGISMTVDAYVAENYMDGMDYRFDGECDRVIMQIAGRNVSAKDYKIGFIDYMGNATAEDRRRYDDELHAHRLDKRLKRLGEKVAKRLSRMIGR